MADDRQSPDRQPPDSLSYLFSLEQFGIKFGLDNMRALVDRLGHPERAYRTVHIAGTNGKGSVTAMVDAALRAAGYRSARYTSPHLVDIGERFVIDGRPVSRESLVAAIEEIRPVIEQLQREGVLEAQPTFFEVTTAIAFEIFRRAHVDIAVVEVGLGGRLDATNVVSPVATAITSIAFDHERFLGSTLGEIAYEKAGIIKRGVPVVVGRLEPEAAAAIEQVARAQSAEIVRATERDADGLTIGLEGAHQRANAAIAVRLLDILDTRGVPVGRTAVGAGLASPGWPGRLDLRRLADGRELLLDAAHNPAGAQTLASYLNDHFAAPPPLVFAVMRDKDIGGMLDIVLPAVGRLVLTRASNRRSEDPAVIAEFARARAPGLAITVEPSVVDALEVAWRAAPRIVVAGSIFLLGDVLRLIELSTAA